MPETPAPAAPALPAATGIPYGRALRRLFRLDDAATFLNHGSFGLTPLAVLATQAALREEMERQPVQFLNRATLQPRLRAAAAQLAGFLGVAAEDLVFVDNATTGVNAVLRSFSLKPGDEVLITDHTYPAVRNAVRFVCGRAGARMVEARLPFPAESPDGIVAAVTATLTDRTRLAVFDLVSSASAIIMPAAALARVCRDAGARVLIDAAHGPGMLDLDLSALQADWVTGNAHKWLFAPKGCALLWAAKEAQRDLHPPVISHGFEQGFANEFDWTGTRDPTAWLTAPSALDFYRSMGDGTPRARNHDLVVAAASLLAERWGTESGAPPGMTGAMAVVRLPGGHPGTPAAAQAVHDKLLQKYHIEVPVMSIEQVLWVRVSAQIYNDLEDYQRLAIALAEA
jgi:isopenicillin-N epimerase